MYLYITWYVCTHHRMPQFIRHSYIHTHQAMHSFCYKYYIHYKFYIFNPVSAGLAARLWFPEIMFVLMSVFLCMWCLPSTRLIVWYKSFVWSVSLMLKIGISQNTNYIIALGFCKSGHKFSWEKEILHCGTSAIYVCYWGKPEWAHTDR